MKKIVLSLVFCLIFFTSCQDQEESETTETTETEELIREDGEKNKKEFEEVSSDSDDEESTKENSEKSEVSEKPDENYVRDTEVLSAMVDDYLTDQGIDPSRVGLIYYNLDDKTQYELNPDSIFLAASVSKLPIVVYMFDLANSGNINLSQELVVQENNLEGGTGTIYYNSGAGASYTMYDLASFMISYSDNTATNMIYSYFYNYNGEYLLNTLNRVLGISSQNGNYITPGEAMGILKRIYYNEEENPLYDDIITFMKDQVYNDYFTLLIDEETIAHKTGDFDGYFNDVGIVYNDDSNYAFSVFTDNIDSPIESLNDLGLIVHNWHTGNIEE